MADDIDDLLSEVESKYCNSRSPQQKSHTVTSRSLPQTFNKSKNDDLDDLIEEIFDDEYSKKSIGVKKQGNRPKQSSVTNESFNDGTSSSLSKQNKCFTTFIGGSNCPQGHSTTVSSKCCDRLRCTDCDFQVASFDNYQWHSSVDYLFLRNNMPDFPRLKAKLVVKKGSRAYSCQCKWKSLKGEDLVNLQTEPDLKWFCGKH